MEKPSFFHRKVIAFPPFFKTQKIRKRPVPASPFGLFHIFHRPYYYYYEKYKISIYIQVKRLCRLCKKTKKKGSATAEDMRMKIIFSKQLFLEKLYPAMVTVSTKNTIPSIEGVLIETIGGRLVRLSTFDMNKGVRATLEAEDVMEGGSFIINAQRLMGILKVLSDDRLTIEVNDSMNATISAGRASFSLAALPGADFPSLPELSGSRGFVLPSEDLKNMIGRVLHSVADQDTRPMLCGAFFRIGEGRMEVISCDSYTLSRCKAECDLRDVGEVSVLDFSFIIPGHALSELIRILGDGEETVSVQIARKHAIFTFRDIIFFTRMIDSEYIDYERIIPRDQTIRVVVERERLIDALERAQLIAEEKIQGSGRSYVKLVLDGNRMVVTSTSVNGRVFDELPIEHEGEGLEIGFNCRYLINSVRATTGEKLELFFKSPTQSVTICPNGADERVDFFYMVLPVRMNG